MPTQVSPDMLMSIARQAAGEYLARGTDLTTAVVKEASASRLPLTDEHVRRICEMTYHEAFERSFHQKRGSLDRYISFDPPDAVQCAKELKAMTVEKKASAPSQGRALAPTEFLKAASAMAGTPAREKYQPVNAYLATVLTPNVEKVAAQDNWHNPMGDIARAHQALREAIRKVELDLDSAEHGAKIASAQLSAQSVQACKDGADVSDVLNLCYHAAEGAGITVKVAHDTVCEIAEVLKSHGFDTRVREKTASYEEPNLSHPIAVVFAKVASLRDAQMYLSTAAEDLRAEYALSSRKVRAAFAG